jgi:hypothetical protein
MEQPIHNQQVWTEDELRDLILFAKQVKEENDELRSNMILLEAKLNNEEAKVKKLTNFIKQFTNVNN